MKKSLSFIFICLFALTPPAPARQQEPLANNGKLGLNAKSLDQVLKLQDEQVDLATAALIISENWSNIVYGRNYLSRLDDMAFEIRSLLAEKKTQADYRAIPVINEYLFDTLGFKAISESNDPNNLFLHTVIDKKSGYCLSLSILYLSIGERLGIPLYGVVVPGHFFVRYDDGQVKFNIETTNKGTNPTDEQYIAKFKIPRNSNAELYMKNLNKIQILGCFFNNLGNCYSDIGDTEAALQTLTKAVQINPGLAEARVSLGNIFLKKNQLSRAVNEYLVALKINPDDAKTHNNIANAYIEQNRLNYAVSEYQQAISLDPNFTDAYRNLALAYTRQQRYTLAIARLRQAIALKPEEVDSYNQLGEVYSKMGNYPQAIKEYEKAIMLKNDSIETYYGLASCYKNSGSTNEEITVYKKILEFKPNDYNSLVNLATVYFQQEKYADSIELYRKATIIEPNEAMIYYNIGAAYSNSQNFRQAEVEYLKALELDPKAGQAHYGLAFVYYQLEKFELSWKHITTAQELGIEVSKDKIDAIKSNL